MPLGKAMSYGDFRKYLCKHTESSALPIVHPYTMADLSFTMISPATAHSYPMKGLRMATVVSLTVKDHDVRVLYFSIVSLVTVNSHPIAMFSTVVISLVLTHSSFEGTQFRSIINSIFHTMCMYYMNSFNGNNVGQRAEGKLRFLLLCFNFPNKCLLCTQLKKKV